MRPAIRIQATYDVQKASDDAETYVNPNEPSTARPEFAADCDVNRILQKGGVPIFTRQPTFGEIDFDRDLATAIREVRLADTLFAQLPAALRETYKNRDNLIRAIDNGQITKDLASWVHEQAAPPPTAQTELLKWLTANHTAPKSSPSPNPAPHTTSTSPPAPAAGSAQTAPPGPTR